VRQGNFRFAFILERVGIPILVYAFRLGHQTTTKPELAQTIKVPLVNSRALSVLTVISKSRNVAAPDSSRAKYCPAIPWSAAMSTHSWQKSSAIVRHLIRGLIDSPLKTKSKLRFPFTVWAIRSGMRTEIGRYTGQLAGQIRRESGCTAYGWRSLGFPLLSRNIHR